ncbi:MAG TPA: ERAP1-like C-terminal domain-containing protein, partial [Bryobacteraceae bacterium]|nr:ERAP1-like C-terminal domain-containing protein [Bryobacteraceae bacterium]
ADTLALAETFHNDPERHVLQASLELALYPATMLVPDRLQPNYQRYLRKNYQARARELGWTAKPGESDETKLLRPTLLRVVATWGGDTELAAEARALTEKWFTDHTALDPNMVSAVLRSAAFFGDKALAERFLTELKKEKDRQVRQTLLSAMNSFRDSEAIALSMNALLKGDVPFMEGSGLLFGGQLQDSTRKMSLNFLRSNFDQIVAKMPTGGGFDFGSVLPHVGASYCDAASRDELKAFFQPRVEKFVGAPRALDQTLESIDLCIANKAAQGASVAAFLGKY